MRPPPIWRVKPKSHRIMRTTKIVQSIEAPSGGLGRPGPRRVSEAPASIYGQLLVGSNGLRLCASDGIEEPLR